MTTITLNTPIIIVPAQEAVTASTFVVKYIEENYGVDYEENSGRGSGRGRPRSVNADIEIGTEPGPGSRRTLTVWEGDEYLAVRGTWTDQDLYNKIKQILESNI